MKLRFQNFRRKLRVIGSLAFNIIQFLAALIAIITTAAGASIIAWLFHSQGLIIPLSTFLLGVFVTFFVVILFLIKASPPKWVLRGYKHVRTDIIYVIDGDDPTHHTLTVETEIEAIQSGVSSRKVFEVPRSWVRE